jgi:AraC-like DNA-binding protein
MYREIQPSGRLAQFVECFWLSQPDVPASEPSEIRVVPDGCIDLIFDRTPHQENAYWVGTMTTSLCLKSTIQRSLLGIRFHPGGARQFLPCSAAELANQRVPISDLTPDLSELLESIVEQSHPVRNLHNWLECRVVPTTRSRFVMAIHRQLDVNKKISTVAEEMGCSRQYLNRIMNDAVGIDLKRFSRILRMRKLINTLTSSSTALSWIDCAVSFGFYDQSHLINEFKDLVGVNPSEFLRGLK